MKWNYLLSAGALVGVFSLGAMFAPIDKPLATVNQPQKNSNLSFVQTTNGKENPQQGETDFTCPNTGQAMGTRSGMGMMSSLNEVISQVLGMTIDEFQAALREGKSVAELAEEKGVKVKDLVKVILEFRKNDLAQLVKDGELTQNQMDNMLKNMETMMEQAIEMDIMGPLNGTGMGMGQEGGCSADSETQQSQTGMGVHL
jgi:hypothetical protein